MKDEVQISINELAAAVDEMMDLVGKGLMANDMAHLDEALNKERIIDDMEKKITIGMAEKSKKGTEEDRALCLKRCIVVQNLERIGDELLCLVERIEMKIADKMYFSEDGINQYNELFNKTRAVLQATVKYVKEGKRSAVSGVTAKCAQVQKDAVKCQKGHLERLSSGVCKVRASNLYFDMCDVTGNVARHCADIIAG